MRTTGTVDWDNDHTTQAITQVSGPITRIVADTGTRVKAGDPLLYVASTDVTNAISRLPQGEEPLRPRAAQRSIATRTCSSTRRSPQRDFESAQADYNDAATDVQTALQALKIFGVSQTDITEAEAAERRRSGRSWPCARRSPGRRRAEDGPARPVHPGRHDGGLRHQQHVDGLGAGPRLRQGPARRCTSATRPRAQLVVPADVPRRRVVHRRHDRPGDAHHAGAHRHAEPATACSRRTCSSTSSSTTRRRTRSLVVPTTAVLYDEQNFPFVYVQVDAGQVRAAAGEARRRSRATTRRSSTA